MRILGFDPGYATVGFGAIDAKGDALSFLDCGAIETAAHQRIEKRLSSIGAAAKSLIERFEPDAVAIEELFFYSNQTTAINVAQARGVLLYICEECAVHVFEYTPMQVKSAVVGYGKAQKRQVMEMTKSLLRLPGIPKPDDAADALAICVCHAHFAQSKLSTLSSTLADSKKTAGR